MLARTHARFGISRFRSLLHDLPPSLSLSLSRRSRASCTMRSRRAPEFFKIRGNLGNTNVHPTFLIFSRYVYLHLSYLALLQFHLIIFLSCSRDILSVFPIGSRHCWGGESVHATILHISPPFMPRHPYAWRHHCLDTSPDYRRDIKIPQRCKETFRLDLFGAEFREWTRRLIRWSSAPLVARSRSVSVWSVFGPTPPTRSFIALSGWSLSQWRRLFNTAISSCTFAPTICRTLWTVWAPRCRTVSCCWNLRYSGLIDGEFPFAARVLAKLQFPPSH